MKVVVIGCKHAGTSASLGVAALRKDARITIYERDGNDGNNFFPGGTVPAGVAVKALRDVTAVDFGAKMIEIRDVLTGEISYDAYDKLIIATGARPKKPEIENAGLKNILVCKDGDFPEEITARAPETKKIALIGAGCTGVGLTAAFRARGVEVVLIDQEKHILPGHLDVPFAEEAKKLLTEKGVTLVLGERVSSFKGDLNSRVSAVVTDRGDYEAGLVILCAGCRPDTGIFKGKLDMLENGAISTDEYMRASAPDVFAAGSAAAVWNNALGAYDYVPLASNAVRMGALAARNLMSNTTKHPGAQFTIALEIYGLHIAFTGLTQGAAARAGIGALAVSFSGGDIPKFMPSEVLARSASSTSAVRLVYDGESRRLLGGQIMSRDGLTETINTLSLCIQKGMTIDELAFADFLSDPDPGKPQNFLNTAARLALPPL
jgi:NADPH-dependent 2,4-dienoyl-CoA reductase/sulfur reductase-like enzyme